MSSVTFDRIQNFCNEFPIRVPWERRQALLSISQAGVNIYSLREFLGLTIEEFAYMLALNPSYVATLESVARPTIAQMMMMSAHVNYDIEFDMAVDNARALRAVYNQKLAKFRESNQSKEATIG